MINYFSIIDTPQFDRQGDALGTFVSLLRLNASVGGPTRAEFCPQLRELAPPGQLPMVNDGGSVGDLEVFPY